MPLSVLVSLALAIIALLFVARWAYRYRLMGLEKAWLPEDLQGAALIYMERIFRMSSPVPIVAKLDRGYRKADGVIILAELKTRSLNRPYPSDVIELSAQRLAVQAQTGQQVANYGYVVIQQAGSKRKMAHRVTLMSIDDVTAVAKRRDKILAKEVVPQYAGSQRICDRCAFKLKCGQTADPWR